MITKVTAWKLSQYGVISGPNTGKYGPEITGHISLNESFQTSKMIYH